jgi:hypothetical protein
MILDTALRQVMVIADIHELHRALYLASSFSDELHESPMDVLCTLTLYS